MIKSKWSKLDNQIESYIKDSDLKDLEIAQQLLNTKESTRQNKDVNLLRTYITRFRNRGIKEVSNTLGIAESSIKHLWHEIRDEDGKKKGNAFIKNPDYKELQEKDFETLSKALLSDLKAYIPKYDKIVYEDKKDAHLLVIDPADVHIGKLCSSFEVGETYNNQIAVQRVLQGVKGILNKVKGFEIDQINLIIGNDILHIDSPKRQTTSGTPQDTDGMWHTNFIIAKQLYVDVIEILMQIAPVHVTYNPSNHDYTHGFFLAQVIETHFNKCENVTFDTSIAHRKYYTYFDNLIGSTHGDGAKTENLALLMAHESKDWSNCKHKYVYTHHLHHKVSKDVMGVCVETLRSPSGTDSWHHRNGYQHAPKAIEGFLHHKENGQIARITHLF
jgi:hypothetical protein